MLTQDPIDPPIDGTAWADASTREKLVSVTAALFARRGYAATTTREIAAELNISKAALYYHVDSKEDLLYEISKQSLTRITAGVRATIAEGADTTVDLLRRMVGEHLRLALEDRDMHITMLIELRSLSAERFETIRDMRDVHELLFREVIRTGQDAGEISTDFSDRHFGLALMNLLNWTIFWYRPGGELDLERLTDLLATTFLRGAETPGVR
jgi:AcrR family transcriptional regulator